MLFAVGSFFSNFVKTSKHKTNLQICFLVREDFFGENESKRMEVNGRIEATRSELKRRKTRTRDFGKDYLALKELFIRAVDKITPISSTG